MPSVVLFLCTGNYYRSRFAEAWFNHLAKRRALGWVAESAGLANGCHTHNPGPISPHALRALQEHGLAPEAPRSPTDATLDHFARAARIVALYRAEHQPMLATKFPLAEPRVEYWHCPDVGEMSPRECLPDIQRRVQHLVDELERPRAG